MNGSLSIMKEAQAGQETAAPGERYVGKEKSMSVGFTCQAVVKDKRFVKQMIRMLGEEKRYEVRQEEDYMRVGFCRLGDLFFQFGSGLDGEIPTQMVYGECTSSLAGAGFHAAAVSSSVRSLWLPIM